MMRSYSRRSQSPSSCSVHPVLFSSNLELFDGSDPDWVDEQLEQARLRRAPFYRRLQNASGRQDDNSALRKYRKSPETEVVDEATPSLDFEPHSSWRFYTSYDNGEWRRHAVPVLKVKDVDQTVEVNGFVRYRQGVASMSGCEAAESGSRRARQSRTTAAELQQKRISMRGSGCLGDISNQRMLSCSMESFRGISSGVGCSDASSSFDHFARDARRSVSPRNQLMAIDDVAILDDDVIRGDSLSKRRSPFEGFELTGSVKINGVEAKLEDKIIVPTKYKSTATGNPESETSTGSRDCISGNDVNSRRFCRRSVAARLGKMTQEKGGSRNPSCMTGLGEGNTVQTSTPKIENVLSDKNRQIESGSSERLTLISKEQNKNARLTVGRRSEAVRMREEQRTTNSSDGLESSPASDEETGQHKTDDKLASNHLSAVENEAKVIITGNKTNTGDDGNMREASSSTEINSGGVEKSGSTTVEPSRETRGQKQEITSEVDTGEVENQENVLCPEEKIVKFVSVYFVNVNCGHKATNTMESMVNTLGTSQKEMTLKTDRRAEKKDVSIGRKFVELDDDDEWVVEMAVRD